jgi:hypothetical protein
MARKPQDAVQFTLESAERIADVVRAAELATPQGKPLTFEARFPDRMPKQVRAATFTGSWAINASKVVTFKYAPTATQTVVNLTMPAPIAGDCVVGKEGTSWWVVSSLNATTRLCKTSTAFNKGTVATLNVWESGTPPNETQTSGVTVPNVINKYANIASSKWVSVALHGNGRWYVIAAECS